MRNVTELPDTNAMFSEEHRFASALVQMERELATIPNRLQDDALFTTRETAVQLSVSARTLEKWRTDGRGPAITRLPSGGVRYSGASIRAFIQANTQANGRQAQG